MTRKRDEQHRVMKSLNFGVEIETVHLPQTQIAARVAALLGSPFSPAPFAGHSATFAGDNTRSELPRSRGESPFCSALSKVCWARILHGRPWSAHIDGAVGQKSRG
jgi:hypothetical protein